jgi:hypothetical protein
MTTSPPITLSVDGQHGSIAAQAAGRHEAEELHDDENFEDDILVSYYYFIESL